MSLRIAQLSLGALQTNCYIVGDSITGDAVIIDPAAEAEVILAKVKEYGYNVREILITHAHFDHVIASKPVKEALNIPMRIHQKEVEQLQTMTQRARLFGIQVSDEAAEPDAFVEHGDKLSLGSLRFEVRFTPGHSPGHVTFVLPDYKVAFVGDCIFNNGIGRTDLPGADASTLKKSIVEQILTLGDNFTLCPGHGPTTTVGNEKVHSINLAYLLKFTE
jgi:glyoxylase-like metal-dependent hydrolase (beta-lactamase superfamily II)